MGGHNSGELASQLAVDCLSDAIREKIDFLRSHPSLLEQFLIDSIQHANKIVFEASTNDDSNAGMGTTVVCAVLMEDRVVIAHVGDSRGYIIDNQNIKQITYDHSYIQELIDSGTISKEEAKNHPKRNVITRALGFPSEVKPEVYTIDFNKGQVLLLCTDGLSNLVEDEEIANVVRREKEPAVACNKLVEITNQNGGNDNVTIVIVVN
jgi:protein phosphatase